MAKPIRIMKIERKYAEGFHLNAIKTIIFLYQTASTFGCDERPMKNGTNSSEKSSVLAFVVDGENIFHIGFRIVCSPYFSYFFCFFLFLRLYFYLFLSSLYLFCSLSRFALKRARLLVRPLILFA